MEDIAPFFEIMVDMLQSGSQKTREVTLVTIATIGRYVRIHKNFSRDRLMTKPYVDPLTK